MAITNESSFALYGGQSLLTFRVCDDRLLFLHAPFLSSQWPLNEIGVMLTRQPKLDVLGISSTGSLAHQSWYIERREFERLRSYFRALGFPVPDMGPLATAEG